jgi:hypothetical protein
MRSRAIFISRSRPKVCRRARDLHLGPVTLRDRNLNITSVEYRHATVYDRNTGMTSVYSPSGNYQLNSFGICSSGCSSLGMGVVSIAPGAFSITGAPSWNLFGGGSRYFVTQL